MQPPENSPLEPSGDSRALVDRPYAASQDAHALPRCMKGPLQSCRRIQSALRQSGSKPQLSTPPETEPKYKISSARRKDRNDRNVDIASIDGTEPERELWVLLFRLVRASATLDRKNVVWG